MWTDSNASGGWPISGASSATPAAMSARLTAAAKAEEASAYLLAMSPEHGRIDASEELLAA